MVVQCIRVFEFRLNCTATCVCPLKASERLRAATGRACVVCPACLVKLFNVSTSTWEISRDV